MNGNRTIKESSRRLADIRTQLLVWSATRDTSNWDATFFLALLDRKNQEIAQLRKRLPARSWRRWI
jgi:hypothetical protein